MTGVMDGMVVKAVRESSRQLVRGLGLMNSTLAGTTHPPSAVHALVEIGARGPLRASDLCRILALEKSSVSRMIAKLVAAGEVTQTPADGDIRSKMLALTGKGRGTLAAINAFADKQVMGALGRLSPLARRAVVEGLSCYADALGGSRGADRTPELEWVKIESGFQSGAIGRIVEMHGRYYARTSSFGSFFESKVALGLAEFVGRLGNPVNQLWLALHGGHVVGSVAIDGEDLGSGIGHLRWFIVDDAAQGSGIGRRLLSEAVAFADRRGFPETQLWTFRGLDAARRLYEAAGFVLVEEAVGRQWGAEVTEQRFSRAAPTPPAE